MLWEDINYAHIILTPNGNYYLSLIAGPDLFNDYRVLFIPLHKQSDEAGQERISAFAYKLLSKIEKGEVSCYPEDLNWI
jgi:hypothetical protein